MFRSLSPQRNRESIEFAIYSGAPALSRIHAVCTSNLQGIGVEQAHPYGSELDWLRYAANAIGDQGPVFAIRDSTCLGRVKREGIHSRDVLVCVCQFVVQTSLSSIYIQVPIHKARSGRLATAFRAQVPLRFNPLLHNRTVRVSFPTNDILRMN